MNGREWLSDRATANAKRSQFLTVFQVARQVFAVGFAVVRLLRGRELA